MRHSEHFYRSNKFLGLLASLLFIGFGIAAFVIAIVQAIWAVFIPSALFLFIGIRSLIIYIRYYLEDK